MNSNNPNPEELEGPTGTPEFEEDVGELKRETFIAAKVLFEGIDDWHPLAGTGWKGAPVWNSSIRPQDLVEIYFFARPNSDKKFLLASTNPAVNPKNAPLDWFRWQLHLSPSSILKYDPDNDPDDPLKVLSGAGEWVSDDREAWLRIGREMHQIMGLIETEDDEPLYDPDLEE